MGRVVITEFMDEAAVARLAEDHDVLYDPDLVDDRARMIAEVAAADGLIVRNRTSVDADLLDAASGVRVVGRLGVGLDNIDLETCAERGIAVRPATGANTDAVAEYVVAAVLMLVRGSFLLTDRVISGAWPRAEASGLEVAGRTMGLVGFGAIAQRVGHLVRGLGMHVAAHDPFVPEGDPAWDHADHVGLDRLLDVSDAVSIHVPLTDDTRGLIGGREIARMRHSAVIVNTSRGGVVDEDAVAAALTDGRLRGAALDVFAAEPLDAAGGSRFRDVPNLVLTPHIAGITHESNRRVSDLIADEVMAVLGTST